MSSPTPSTRYRAPGAARVRPEPSGYGADHPHATPPDTSTFRYRPVPVMVLRCRSGDEVGHRPVRLAPRSPARWWQLAWWEAGFFLVQRSWSRLPASGYLGDHPARDAVIGVRVIAARPCRGTTTTSAPYARQHADLVLRHLVRADEDAPVARGSAATIASPTPVLPEVGSTIVPPGFKVSAHLGRGHHPPGRCGP